MSGKQTFNVNNQGTVIAARRALESRASLAIAVVSGHFVALVTLYVIVFAFTVSSDTYNNVLLYLFGLVGIGFLLATAVAAQRETRPKSVGELDAAQTLGIIAIVSLVLGVGMAVLAFWRESSSSASFSIYLWGIVWGVGLVIALTTSVLLYLAIQKYRRAYERTLRDECRKTLIPGTVAGGMYDFRPNDNTTTQATWMGGSSSA